MDGDVITSHGTATPAAGSVRPARRATATARRSVAAMRWAKRAKSDELDGNPMSYLGRGMATGAWVKLS